MNYRQESLDRVCKYRSLPELKVGAECEMNGRRGIIVGGDNAARLTVLFDDCNHVNSCHPGYKMRIFNSTGGACHESDDLYAPTTG